MQTKILAIAAGVVLALAACSDDAKKNTGGTGGTGGGGGTGGSGEETCLDLPLPGAIADGHWSTKFGIAGLTGQDGVTPTVYGLTKDADGGVVATGYFSWAGGKALPPAAKLGPAGWEPLRTEWGLDLPASGFAAAAVSDTGAVALATYFATAPGGWGAGEPRVTEIWLDDGDGFRSIGTANGLVHDLVWYNDALWAGGPFELESGESAGLAVWDGAAWSAPPGGAPDGSVYTVSRDGESLLVGGQFENIGGIASARVAEFDGQDWIAQGMDWDVTVYTLARKDGELFAGGIIIPDLETPVGGIAHQVDGQWELLGGGVAAGWFPGTVGDLAVFQGDLYVAGCFKTLGGGEDGIPAANLARWTDHGWEAVGDPMSGVGSVWFNPLSCGDMGPYSRWDMQFQRFLVDGDRLLLAGSFGGVDDVASQSVIAFDGEKWSPVGEAGDGLSGDPGAFAVGGPDCTLHVLAHNVSHAGGAPAGGVLRYDDGWTSVGGRAPARNECERMVVGRNGTIYVGCFEEPEGEGDLRPRVYAVDATGWKSMGEPNSLSGLLFDMAIDRHDRVWIAGGAEKGFVARLDDGKFEVLASDFDAPVFRLAVEPKDGDRAIVSGYFTKRGDVEAAGIAHFDGSEWETLPGLGSTVVALAYAEHGIYASTTLEGDPDRPILAHWDGAAWTDIATPANGLPAPYDGTVHTFTALLPRGDKLIASGYVWPDEGGRNVFVWDGSRFTGIGGGLAAISVDSIAIAKDGLWFGGSIAEAGLKGERIPTVGVAHFTW